MLGALVGVAGSSTPSLKRWVFCAASRRSFFFFSFFPLSLYSEKVSQRTDYTSAYFMAGESRRPWQISIHIKQALLRRTGVETTVDFPMRDCAGAWSLAVCSVSWPGDADRGELPGMLQSGGNAAAPMLAFGIQ